MQEQDFIKCWLVILDIPPTGGSSLERFPISAHFYSQLLFSPGLQNSMQHFLSPPWRAAEPVNCVGNDALQCLAAPDGVTSSPSPARSEVGGWQVSLSGQDTPI